MARTIVHCVLVLLSLSTLSDLTGKSKTKMKMVNFATFPLVN